MLHTNHTPMYRCYLILFNTSVASPATVNVPLMICDVIHWHNNLSYSGGYSFFPSSRIHCLRQQSCGLNIRSV